MNVKGHGILFLNVEGRFWKLHCIRWV